MFDLLTAALAFAVLMIALSVLVTALVEVFQAVFGLRSGGLRRILRRLYWKDVWPVVQGTENPVVRGTENKEKMNQGFGKLNDFLDDMTRRPSPKLYEASNARSSQNKDYEWMKWLQRWFGIRTHNSMTLYEFAARLADTEVGDTIIKNVEARKKEEPEEEFENLVKAGSLALWVPDLARRFERYAEDIRPGFAQRAKAVSIGIAMMVALVVNVDSVRVFNYLVQNPEKADSLAARFDTLLPLQAPDDSVTENDEELFEAIQAARADLEELEKSGLPIGYSYFPFCRSETRLDDRCPKTLPKVDNADAKVGTISTNLESLRDAVAELAKLKEGPKTSEARPNPSGEDTPNPTSQGAPSEAPTTEAPAQSPDAGDSTPPVATGPAEVSHDEAIKAAKEKVSDEAKKLQGSLKQIEGMSSSEALAWAQIYQQIKDIGLLQAELEGYRLAKEVRGDQKIQENQEPDDLILGLEELENQIETAQGKLDTDLVRHGFRVSDDKDGGWWARIFESGHGGAWFASTVLAGLLIGLGGPFWYRFGENLVKIRGFFGRASSASTSESQDSPPPPASTEHEEKEAQVGAAVAHFNSLIIAKLALAEGKNEAEEANPGGSTEPEAAPVPQAEPEPEPTPEPNGDEKP